jgi:hypothetical protein
VQDNRPDWMGFLLPVAGLLLIVWWMLR